jgi:hypothetical protein
MRRTRRRDLEERIQPVLDADGRVSTDLPCVECGYNLRTQTLHGRCPECGAPILRSLQSDHLIFANRAWLRSLHRGTGLLLGAIAWTLIGACAIASAGSDGLLAVVVLGAGSLRAIGLVAVTSREPHSPQARARKARPAVRTALAVEVALITLAVVSIAGGPAVGLAFLAILVAFVLIPGLLFWRLAGLMSRASRGAHAFACHTAAVFLAALAPAVYFFLLYGTPSLNGPLPAYTDSAIWLFAGQVAVTALASVALLTAVHIQLGNVRRRAAEFDANDVAARSANSPRDDRQ